MNIWESGNLTCGYCNKKKNRRVMSPFISFKPTTLDWVVDIQVPVYKNGEFRTEKMCVCPDCFCKIANSIKKPVVKKSKVTQYTLFGEAV